jgi:hypothetical protein
VTTPPKLLHPKEFCRVLSLDGGGAKGLYTLGVLAQVEALVKGPKSLVATCTASARITRKSRQEGDASVLVSWLRLQGLPTGQEVGRGSVCGLSPERRGSRLLGEIRRVFGETSQKPPSANSIRAAAIRSHGGCWSLRTSCLTVIASFTLPINWRESYLAHGLAASYFNPQLPVRQAELTIFSRYTLVVRKMTYGVNLMARRVRTTITVREDDPVPRRRSKKKESSILVAVILIVLALFVLARTNRSHGPQPQRVAAPR